MLDVVRTTITAPSLATRGSSATDADLDAEIAARIAADALKANIASPTFTGNPAAPTPSPGDNDTSIATTAFVTAAVGVEEAARIATDALKAPLASPALTGNPTAPTATQGDNDTSIATTAFVTTAVAAEAATRAAADIALDTRVDDLELIRYPIFAGGGSDTIIDSSGLLGDGLFKDVRGTPRRGRPGIIYRTEDTKAIRAIWGYGQSLSAGYVTSGGAAALTTTPPSVTREFMFSYGPRLGDMGNPTTPMPQERVTGIIPYRETLISSQFGETAGHGLMSKLTSSYETWEGLMWGVFGWSGQLYDLGFEDESQVGLRKGGVLFRNMERATQSAWDICFDNGIDFTLEAVAFDHGESDEANTQPEYKADLLEFQADVAGMARRCTGQGFDPLILISQDSSWPESGSDSTTLAQFEVVSDYPEKFVFSGPKYQLPYDDNRHLTSIGYRRLGEYHGLAMQRKIAGDVVATLPLRATRNVDVITIYCDVPVLPLVIDTALVSDPGNYGVEYTQVGGTPRTILSVNIHGDGDKVVVVLSGDPGSPTIETVDFAMNLGSNPGPTTGARCCIHDSTTTIGIDSTVLHSYMPHAIIDVTISLGSEA